MLKIRNMTFEDIETVARMVALDHDSNPEKGYKEARVHTLDHLKIVPRHCYLVEEDDRHIVAVMVLHPQDRIFEIEDFHVEETQRNKEALVMLKTKLLEYLISVQTEVLCCPYALRRLVMT